ncbi:MAG: hypothetical protein LBQ90_12050, partial [Synergistaceae bacterium]|nr:hypothetical protein [Synergistaceae bacterium]
MSTTETQEPEMGLTFEKVWAALLKSQENFDRRMQESREAFELQKKENDRQLQKSREDFDRGLQKSREAFELQKKETDRRLQKSREDFDRGMRETRQLIGELGRKFGSAVEHMVAPNLVGKFNALGF